MKETIHPTRLQREKRAQRSNPEKPKGGLERYLKYTPLAYFYLIIYSYVGLDTFYSEFGIEILGFMSVQEMLVLPLENVKDVFYTTGITTIYLIALFLFLFLTAGIIDLIVRFSGQRSLKRHVSDVEKIYPQGDSVFELTLVFTVVLSLSTDYSVFDFGQIDLSKGIGKLFVKYLIVGVPVQIIALIWWNLDNKSYISLDKAYLHRKLGFRLVFIVGILTYVNHLYMLNRAREFVLENSNEVKIELKDPKKRNTRAFLLGTTNSSIFLLDTAARETFVIPKSEIRELRYIKEKEIEDIKPDSVPADTLQQVETDTLKSATYP